MKQKKKKTHTHPLYCFLLYTTFDIFSILKTFKKGKKTKKGKEIHIYTIQNNVQTYATQYEYINRAKISMTLSENLSILCLSGVKAKYNKMEK